ncbi:hypothetical protein NA56DRAFT_748285 [Hyaloscypha hepaticicola]|uniref:Uncharacterized protein n=1 Tax=Hyaloscypha hepaticicola TaxID=2082293 RepID=A0A2J6Q6M3_9HELO|nr:hypothetical protein NA56DRAFT_748285 [Hyaloscypha hepaticicola]
MMTYPPVSPLKPRLVPNNVSLTKEEDEELRKELVLWRTTKFALEVAEKLRLPLPAEVAPAALPRTLFPNVRNPNDDFINDDNVPRLLSISTPSYKSIESLIRNCQTLFESCLPDSQQYEKLDQQTSKPKLLALGQTLVDVQLAGRMDRLNHLLQSHTWLVRSKVSYSNLFIHTKKSPFVALRL